MPESTSFIYVLQNKINNKIYIGQTINFKNRISAHFRIARSGKQNRHLYNAIRLHGWENFKSFVLEEVPRSEADETEMLWISIFNTNNSYYGYNSSSGGGAGGRVPTEATRIKMRDAKLGKPALHMQGENHPLFGVKGENHHRFGSKHT